MSSYGYGGRSLNSAIYGDAPLSSSPLLQLMPYLWPAGRADLKLRVVISNLLLILTPIVTVATPYFFKLAVDELQGAPARHRHSGPDRAHRQLRRRLDHEPGGGATARRHFRQGLLPRAAHDRGGDVPSSPYAVVALSSRAPHRRPLAHHRSRHESDRPAAHARDLQHLSDRAPARHPLRPVVVAAECLVRRRDRGDDRGLCVVHLRA